MASDHPESDPLTAIDDLERHLRIPGINVDRVRELTASWSEQAEKARRVVAQYQEEMRRIAEPAHLAIAQHQEQMRAMAAKFVPPQMNILDDVVRRAAAAMPKLPPMPSPSGFDVIDKAIRDLASRPVTLPPFRMHAPLTREDVRAIVREELNRFFAPSEDLPEDRERIGFGRT